MAYDIKREACASIMPKTKISGNDAAEKWSTSVNWEEDPAVKAKRKERGE